MAYVFNPFTGTLDYYQTASSSAWTTSAVSGTINGINTTFTLSATPTDANSVQLSLDRQLQIQGVDYTLSGATITYTTAPDASLSGSPHYATFQ